MNFGISVLVLLSASLLCKDGVQGGDLDKIVEPNWYWTTTGAPPTNITEFDHVRRLHNVEFQFERLSQNVAKILQIIQHIPSITGVQEILKEVQQIPQIKKILTGPVIRFPSPQYGDVNAEKYYVQGHVEILHMNQWGTICDDSFDNSGRYYGNGERTANVLCRMGGYKGGEYHWGRYKQRHVPKANRIWLDEVYCNSGNETSIGNCYLHNGWGRTDCSHNEDVGIRCYI